MFIDPLRRMRQAQLFLLLERICQALELSDAQFQIAKKHYETVGEWLAASDDPLLKSIAIYLQGSTALGTTVRPIGSNEHDVDLVAFFDDLDPSLSPAALKKAIGDRLKAHKVYLDILVEMPRCWRLVYANEFHLDITPAIINPACGQGGELVPDRKLREWKESNPRGYKQLFLRRVELIPEIRRIATEAARADADIEPYPARSAFKGLLQRAVQIAKRHRDVHFDRLALDPRLSPISVIVTTLLSRSYERCVLDAVYDSELEFLSDVFRRMPEFIETRQLGGRTLWFVWNETTIGENFAEKWNDDPERAEAFYAWHARLLTDIERLAEADGVDRLRLRLGDAFGDAPAREALDSVTADVSTARTAGRLGAVPMAGLVTGATSAAATAVRANTFFGRVESA